MYSHISRHIETTVKGQFLHNIDTTFKQISYLLAHINLTPEIKLILFEICFLSL